MKKQRLDELDIFRGIAIFLMIIYHFIYDLNYFGIIDIDIKDTWYFLLLRYTIMNMFLISVGVSLVLAHQHAINWKAMRKRLLQLGLASIAVTLSTFMVFPNSWVYFGILHFILLSSFVVLPIIKFPKFTLALTILIFIASSAEVLHVHHLFSLLQEPLNLPSPHSQDLVPFFKWIPSLMFGMLLVQFNYHEKFFKQKLLNNSFSINQLFKKMGQHALVIYLIHQPIIFLGFELYFKFFSK